MSRRNLARSLAIAAALLLVSCESLGSGNAPADHTVTEDGVSHKPGLRSPLTNCTSCHGVNLEGGSGPSCTSCHGQKW